MSAAQKSDQTEPFRQGFVGYANVDGRQWRVLVRRFQESYDERRRYFALRALVDDFVEAARGLNRVAVRAGVDGAYGLGTTRELDRLQRQMQFLVAGMRQVAGKEGRAT